MYTLCVKYVAVDLYVDLVDTVYSPFSPPPATLSHLFFPCADHGAMGAGTLKEVAC